MNQFKPKVSVIIPVYNAEKNLTDCLDSLLAQTYHHYEVICVDDGSTDASLDVLQQYQSKFQRMTIVQQKNKGAGAARNVGILRAGGKYLLFVDADDICYKTLLEKTVEAADNNNADIVCYHFDRLYPNGEKEKHLGYCSQWLLEGGNIFNYESCPDHIMCAVNPTPWNKLFLREFVLQESLRFDEISSTNDISFAAVSCAKAKKIVAVDETLYCYRVGHVGTITSSKNKNLPNVTFAIESAICQVKKIPYYPAIREGVCQFIVENYCYALLNYVDDFNTDRARDFYTKAHEAFLSDLFGEMDFSQCWNERLYSNYQIVRNNDYDSLMQKLNRRVIVSMTSFPKRINSVACALQTIYGQTKKPDDIILWLAEDEFPMREKQLPHDLIELIGNGKLSVRWCDDLKPHKKYFYALQEFSEDLIVTIDDDLRYPPDLIEALFRSYLCHSDSVSAVRTHLMIVDDKRELLPYESWPKVFSVCVGKPSMQLLCTGGAGALYPAYLFKGYNFDKEPVLEHCMYADDLWLKLIELSLGIPVVTAKRNYKLQYIEGTQEDALYSNNKTMNDIQLRNSIAWFESQFGEGFIVSQILDNHSFENLMRADVLCQYYNLENRKAEMDANRLRHDLDSVHASASFRIGRAITWLPRKIRGGVRCYKEHGIRYTFNRTLFHLHLRKK